MDVSTPIRLASTAAVAPPRFINNEVVTAHRSRCSAALEPNDVSAESFILFGQVKVSGSNLRSNTSDTVCSKDTCIPRMSDVGIVT